MKKRDVYIASQTGVNPIYNEWAKEALQEWFLLFPNYKDKYPISNLGCYKENDYIINTFEYANLSPQEKSLCAKVNGKYLKPYKSVDWFVAHSIYNGMDKGFRNGEICSDEFINLLRNDSTQNHPQLSISIVSSPLKPNNETEAPDFIHGHSAKGYGCVISIAHLKQMPLKQRENFFKALVMHEFTHACSQRDGHCGNKNCLMESWNTPIDITRANNKSKGIAPICPECWASVNIFFAKDCNNQQDLKQNIALYNQVRNRSRSGNTF